MLYLYLSEYWNAFLWIKTMQFALHYIGMWLRRTLYETVYK